MNLVTSGVRRIAAATAVALMLCGPAIAEEGPGDRSLFLDDKDGNLDLSNLLARGGFLPMPIIITEPAVDGGFGVAANFVRAPAPGSGLPPRRSILGAARTGNGSHGFGLYSTGALFEGNLLYKVAAGTGLSVLDFYPGNRDFALRYNNDIQFGMIGARYRFGDSGFSIGPTYRFKRNEIDLDAGGAFPRLTAFLGRDITLSSLALEAHFDDRDNTLSPTTGLNVIVGVQRYDGAIGSDIEFTEVSAFGAWFGSRGGWTLGAMADFAATTGGAPFFQQPDVDIRGVPRKRFVGDTVLSTELELRRQVSPRWALLGFAGYGRVFGSGRDAADTYAVGAGFRYRIARKIGLDIGVDVARGEHDNTFYIQFGHAWGPRMD